MMTPGETVSGAVVVLDTNVVLDLLLFRDAGVAVLSNALRSGGWQWVVCPRMRDEFERVLQYRDLARWQPDSEQLLSEFDSLARVSAHPASLPSLRCTDADDQVFLDLAVAAQATWLLTHDRALLRLARRARKLGLQITKPSQCSPLTTPAG